MLSHVDLSIGLGDQHYLCPSASGTFPWLAQLTSIVALQPVSRQGELHVGSNQSLRQLYMAFGSLELWIHLVGVPYLDTLDKHGAHCRRPRSGGGF